MVSGRSKAYTDVPAKFIKGGKILKECGIAIPLQELDDILYDVEKDLLTPVFVEHFTEKSLRDKGYIAVDIGGQDLVSHLRIVLQCAGSAQNKTFTAYNPHAKTIETFIYCGKKKNMPVTSKKD